MAAVNRLSRAGGIAFAAVCVVLLACPFDASAETLVVGNKREHTVSFVDLKTGREVARRNTGRAPHEIAVSPDGTLAVVVSYREPGYEGQSLDVFDVRRAKRVRTIDLGEHRGPHGLKWVPGTRRVVVTTEISNDVLVVDVDAGEVLRAIATASGTHMVALAPDARRAYAASISGGNVAVLDLQSGERVRTVEADAGTEAITVTPDGAEIWVGNNEAKTIIVLDSASFERKATLRTDGVPIRVETSPDGELVAVSEVDRNRLVLYSARTREVRRTVDLAPSEVPVTILFDPDGDRLWVAATASRRILEIGTADGVIRRHFVVGDGSDGLGYSPLRCAPRDGRRRGGAERDP